MKVQVIDDKGSLVFGCEQQGEQRVVNSSRAHRETGMLDNIIEALEAATEQARGERGDFAGWPAKRAET